MKVQDKPTEYTITFTAEELSTLHWALGNAVFPTTVRAAMARLYNHLEFVSHVHPSGEVF